MQRGQDPDRFNDSLHVVRAKTPNAAATWSSRFPRDDRSSTSSKTTKFANLSRRLKRRCESGYDQPRRSRALGANHEIHIALEHAKQRHEFVDGLSIVGLIQKTVKLSGRSPQPSNDLSLRQWARLDPHRCPARSSVRSSWASSRTRFTSPRSVGPQALWDHSTAVIAGLWTCRVSSSPSLTPDAQRRASRLPGSAAFKTARQGLEQPTPEWRGFESTSE